MKITANMVALASVLAAIVAGALGVTGWGWFLFVAVVVVTYG
ncbi:hypothetical protein RFM23_05575 [Mesorhizobium abyssinicae]|uniref:Phosphatidate cytidylyltransferase n=1 Tax=Mesorhizobium abyssinicae TaxID=1209958 RepID=A0ABU5AIK0_9HYPH|nr:hypothetical protein [Mesorhizobium abyssinicae]MDX8537093.1 hypothetical protein [Mesorhizobium abyssinicae]